MELVTYIPLLLNGLGVTLIVTVVGSALALVVAFALGLARLSEFAAVRFAGGLLVEVFRGTSLLVLLFWLFFALPFLGIRLAPITAGILALGLNCGAYGAEVVRSAINTRPVGQSEAAVALGLSRFNTLYRILIPQSISVMLPPFGNILVDLLKNSSLVSLVAVADLTFRAQLIRTASGNTLAIFSVLLIMYYMLSLLAGRLISFLEKKADVKRPSRQFLANNKQAHG